MSTRIAPLGLALWLALAAGCSPDSSGDRAVAPVQQEPLEATIEDIVAAIQDKAGGRVLDHVSQEFKSEDGLDYIDVQAIVDSFLLRDGLLGARLESLSVEDSAEPEGVKRVQAWLSFAPGARLETDTPLPDDAVTYSFDLVFAHAQGRWQALRGSYRRQ